MFQQRFSSTDSKTPSSPDTCHDEFQPVFFKIDFPDFSRAILLSSIFHLLLILLFSLSPVIRFSFLPPPAPGEQISGNDLALFSAALEELTREKDWQEKLSRVLAELKDDGLAEIPERFQMLDKNMPEREKIEIYKKILEAYLSGSMETGNSAEINGSGPVLAEKDIQIKTGDRLFFQPSAARDGQVELYLLEAETGRELEAFQKADSLRSAPALIGLGQRVKIKFSGHYAEVPAEYYYRRPPFAEILARGAYLFSVIKGFEELPEKKLLSTSRRPQPPRLFPQGEFLVIYYGEAEIPKAGSENIQKDDRPVFDLKPEEWNKRLDALMSEPEEIQFARFEREYLQKYSWDDPSLAAFTREFINSNLNGVFLVEDEFTTAFDSLEEFFYKKPIFERMAALASNKPASPVRDELLFCLASSLDLERRVINHLEKAYPEAREIYLKKFPLAHVHYSLSKAYVLKKMFEELQSELKRLHFTSLDEVEKTYLEKELAIYRALSERGGQTRARALYAIGLTHWEEGEADLAIKTWQQIEESSCPAHIAGLLKIIREAPSATIYTYIDNELNYQTAKNTKYLYRRQLQFHKWARRKN